MPTMLELMRKSAVPASLMRSAAKGALDFPPAEKIEILVYLASHPVFCQLARMTLAGWNERDSIASAGDPKTAPEVLAYMARPENRRPVLLPALIENPAINDEILLDMAQTPSREIIDAMLRSERVSQSLNILEALAGNPELRATESARVQASLSALDASTLTEEEIALREWQREHAAEIAAEEGKPFEMVGGVDDIETPDGVDEQTLKMRAVEAHFRERISTLQKVSRLTVGQRVQLAMKGSKDERAILIRAGSKVVALAVLASPKVSNSEIENFASMKNVQENVLREIARSRKYMKNYIVVKNLVNNPRCPLDVSITLVKNLLITDLKSLTSNKNLPDTLRKLAMKNYKEKSGPPK